MFHNEIYISRLNAHGGVLESFSKNLPPVGMETKTLTISGLEG